MGKEKQVVSCETCNHKKVCYDLLTNKDYNFKGYGCLRYCRDLTKDSIVISNEEYEKIWLNGWNDGYSEILVDTVKKTVENILEKCIAKLDEWITTSYEKSIKANGGYYGGANNAFHICKENLKELAKQYGVELKE